jgi:hypothetical protein
MLCRCETKGGEELEIYAKYKDFHDDLGFDHLAGELVANLFALDMKLPAAQPCIATVSEDFIDLLPDDANGMDLVRAFGSTACSAFGSVAFKPVRRWSADDLVHKGQLADAVRLYLFDTIVENTDRGVRNPNLLVSGHDFKVIDFGHSFQRCHDDADYDGSRMPWQANGIWNHVAGNMQHVLFGGMRNVTADLIESFTTDLRALSDDAIQDYITMIPAEWGDDTACKIVEYLLTARANADEFETKVKEVLL